MDNIAQLGIKVDSSSIKQATNELSKLTNQSGKTEKSTNALTSGFLNLKNAVIGYASIQTAKQIIDTADSMNLLNARLKLATASTAEYTSQQTALLNIAKQSYTGISDTITLFTKLNPALQQVGATTAQVNNVVASFTKGLQLGGSSAAEASSAILQFSQAMGSGVLRGEEFNAIAEASPKLMSYLAKGLGVAQGELRKMAENGELTASRVSNALLKVKTDIDRDFATLPVTVGKALTNLKTDLSLAINEIDTATGATQSLANGIVIMSTNIGSMAKSIIEFYTESKTFIDEHNGALKQTSGILLGLGTAYAVFTVGGAVIRGIQATTVAVYGLRTAMLALETSIPVIGWIAALAGIAASAYVVAATEVENANLSLSGSVSELDSNLQKLYKTREEITNDKFMADSTQAERKKAIDIQIEAILNQKNAILELKNAEAELQIQRSIFDYNLNSNLSYQQNRYHLFESDPRNQYLDKILNSNNIDISAGLNRKFRTGQIVELGLQHLFNSNNIPFNNFNQAIPAFRGDYTSLINLSITQPLLRGRGKSIVTLNEEASKLYIESAKENNEFITSLEILRVGEAYWNYYTAYKVLSIYKLNDKLQAKVDVTYKLKVRLCLIFQNKM